MKSRTACKRCRLKKIKCDQEFPSCKRCAKLEVPCVSLDPATGKDVPRSYVFFLEDRLAVMMRVLKEYGVDPTKIRGNIPATSDDEPFDLKKYSSVS
uniref:PROTEIN (PYRIMIDINE PATHWAY REGULATOR 1) n=1 Tax=Saccharomyces cerevisiae TaxID=4932 RepID=UPI0000112A0C|nr:Chain A, Protein (pyrimidine Pathway Regulator 1) [Saccharomyces cerevisiae]1PYI_B Chain B, Protein (pyrimidine Pathway Regulator 1) [Saccharomyces cerevisiae]